MKKKAVLFTANTQGGIIQFTIQLFQVLKHNAIDVRVFMPDSVKNSDLRELETSLVEYKKEKKVIDNRSYKKIAKEIERYSPDFIWYMDDSTVSQKVGLYITHSIKQFLTMHDAGNIHPTNDKSLRSRAVIKYNAYLSKKFYKNVQKFILLSPESVKTFVSNFPQYKMEYLLMNLGAHMPKDEECNPPEVSINIRDGYYLFFGRIDKYKGIGKLLQAYQKASIRTPLIIAGSGKLSDEEEELYHNTQNVILINRYILDGEMKWLLSNSIATVLPYIEATQSGVIPLAYYYGKPVIVSDVAGLSQFVSPDKTGFVLHNEEEWINIFQKKSVEDYKKMSIDIEKYYSENFDWNNNIKYVLENI